MAERGNAKVQADDLGKKMRDVAVHRISEKRYEYCDLSEASTRPTPASSDGNGCPTKSSKRRKIKHSVDEIGAQEALLEQGRELANIVGEMLEVLRDLKSQGRELLDAVLRRQS